MDQNLAIDCIEVVENLSQKEKNKILSVLKRDDKLRVGQEQKISQLKQEINTIRKNGVLRAGDDQSKMCIRCRAPLGFLFNRGDICPACRFKVCAQCEEVMFNKSWLCKLCYKQRQLKWLTGEWAASFEQNPLRKWASGTDIRHGSMQVFSGATSIDIGEPESNRTNNNRSSKSAHNGILTSSDQDKQRVEYPKEADQHKLSQLFGVLRSRKPEETTKELQVRRVSTRKYSETDSDSSSSSDVEAPSVTESELDKTESPRSVESPKSRLEAVDEGLDECVESDRLGKHKVAYKGKQKTSEGIVQETVNVSMQDAERIVRPKVAHSSNRPKVKRSDLEPEGSHTQTHPRKRERKKIVPDQTIARELRIKAEEATKVSQSKSVDINLNDPSDNGLVSKRKVVSQTELNSKKLGDPYASRSNESLDKKLESQTQKAYIRKSHENIQVEGKSGKIIAPAIRHSAENLSPKIRNKVNHDIRRSHESLDTAKENDHSNQNIRQARSHEYLPTTVKIIDTQTKSGQNVKDQQDDDYKKGLQKPAVDIEVTHASIHVSDVDKEINSEIDVEEDAEILKGQRAGSPYSFSMDSLPSSNPSPTLRRSIDSSIPESSDTDSLSKLSHHEFSGTESQAKEGSEDDFVVEEISKVRFQRVSKKAAQISVLGKIASSPKRPGSCEGVDRGQRKSQSRGGSGGKDGSDDNGDVYPDNKSKYAGSVSESPHIMFAEAEPVVEEKIYPSEKQSNKAVNKIYKVENHDIESAKSSIEVLMLDNPTTNLKRLNIPSFQLENINRSRSAVSSTGSEPRSAVDLSWFDEYAIDTKQTASRQMSNTSSDKVFEDAQDVKDQPDSDTDSVEGMIDNMARPHLQVENLRRATRASEADSEGSFNITPISPFPPDTFETKMGTYTLTYMESDYNLDAVSTDDNLDAGSDPNATVDPNLEKFVEKKVVIGRKEKQRLTAKNSLDVLIAKQGNFLEAEKDIVEIDTEFNEALKVADESHNVKLLDAEFKISEKQPPLKPIITQLPESVMGVRPQDIAVQSFKPSVKKGYEVDYSFEVIKPGVKMRIPADRKDVEQSKVVGINVSNLGSCYDSAIERVGIENKQDRLSITDMKQPVHMSVTKDANTTDNDISGISLQINEPEVQVRTIKGRKDKANLCAQKSLDLLVFKQSEWVDLAAETVELDSELKTALNSESLLGQNKAESVPLIADSAQPVYGTDTKDAIRTNYDKVDSSLEANEPEIQMRTIAGRQDKSKLVAQKSLDLLVLKQGGLVDFAVDSVDLDSELRMALEQDVQESRSEALEFEDMLVMSDKEIDYLGMQVSIGSSTAEKSDVVQSKQAYLDQKSTGAGTQTSQPAITVNRQIALVKDNASESEESDILSVIEEEEEFSESSEQPEEARVNVAVEVALSARDTTDDTEFVKESICMNKDQMNSEVPGRDMKLMDKVKIIQDKVKQINTSFESPGHDKYEGYDVKIHSKFKKLQERWNAIEKHEADLLDVDEITNIDNRQSKTVDILEFESKSPSITAPDDHSDGIAEDNKFNVQVDTGDRAQTACLTEESAIMSEDVKRQTDTEVCTFDNFTDIVKRTAETLNISAEPDSSKSISDEEELEGDEDKTEYLSEEGQSRTPSDNEKAGSVAEDLFEVQMRPKPGRSNAEIVNEEKINEGIKEIRETADRFQTSKKDMNDQTVRHAKGNNDWDTEICHSVEDEYFQSNVNPVRHSINDTSGICQSLTDLNTELDTSNFEEVVSGKICLGDYAMDKGQGLNIHEELARCQSSGDESELQFLNVASHESVVECQSIAEGDSETFYTVQEDADRCISIDEKSFIEYGADTDDVLVDDSKIVSSDPRNSLMDESNNQTVHRPLVRLSKLRKGVKLPSPTVKLEFGELPLLESSVVEKPLSDISTQGIQDKTRYVNYDLPDGLKDKEIEYKELRDTKKLTVLTNKEDHEPVFPPEPQCFKVPNIPFKIESRLSSSSAPSSPDLSIDLPFTPKDSPQSDKISSHRMSPQTISEGSMSQDDSGLASGGSRGTTPEHKRTDSGYSQSSLPSTLSTVTDRSTEDEEDIDRVLAKMKTRGGHGNLLSVAADSRESIASFYSDAGDIAYSKIPVTGEILFGLNYNYKTGMLEVHIKQCRDIAAVDAKRHRSDPYVKTYLLPDKTRSGKRKTKVKKHTLNPTFDEQLKYSISKSELENRTLWLTVWHNDRFGRNDFLGEVTINFDYYKFDDPSPKWYPLQERLDAQPTSMLTYKGDIVLSIRYVPADKVKTTEFKGKTKRDSGSGSGSGKGQLHVVVKEARNLTAVRSNGFSDPFCKGYLLPERHRSSKQKTAVIKKNCSPAWNHTFIFEDVSIIELQERCLELTIWDYEKLTSNDFLGGTRLNLGTGLSQGKPVDWMDARGEEMTMWQAMLDRPNLWIDGTLILRPNMEKRKF